MNVEKRIAKLERDLKYWTTAFLAVVLLLLFVAMDKTDVPDVLMARSFQLISEDGSVTGTFETDSLGTRMVILNEVGNHVAQIAEHDESGAMLLSAADGTPGVMAFANIDEFDHGIISTYTRAGLSLWTSTYGELPEE